MSQTQLSPGSQQSSQQTGRSGQGTDPQSVPQAAVGRMVPTGSYLSQEVRTNSVAMLNQALADITVLKSQADAAHWNVRGRNFYQLHELFEEVAETLEAHADTIAERATALGGEALGTTRIAARQSTIPEFPRGVSDETTLLQTMAANLAVFDQTLFRQIEAADEQGDLDTADLLNEVSRDVSKVLWFVEAHLQGQEVGAQAQGQASTGGAQMQAQRQFQ